MEHLPEYIDTDHKDLAPQRREKAPRIQKARPRKAPPPALPLRNPIPYPRATFEMKICPGALNNEHQKLRPRFGTLKLQRSRVTAQGNVAGHGLDAAESDAKIEIQTPGMICSSRRGVVKHLSRDNVTLAKGVEWIHTPLEDFLEHPVPIPAYHPSSHPLHGFLAHPPSSHIISLSLRDPHNNQNMPANTNTFVQTRTVRGVRKVGIDDWIRWSKALRPDLIWAFVDIPKTLTGLPAEEDTDAEKAEVRDVIAGEGRQTSQKRTVKSLDRSWLWIERLVRELTAIVPFPVHGSPSSAEAASTNTNRPPIIVPLMGGCDPRARAEFSRGIVDKLDTPIPEGDDSSIRRLEDGITGYAVELVDLPTNALNTPPRAPPTSIESHAQETNPYDEPNVVLELLRASLEPLSSRKLRIAHSAPSPHSILRLVAEAGMDLFDMPWIAEASDLGIALDFHFPAPSTSPAKATPIGCNLFEERFAMDFEPIGDLKSSWTCNPTFSPNHILHGRLDAEQYEEHDDDLKGGSGKSRPFTRAYVHHLLHTHEMGAYALLHLHNLAVMDRFFKNIRLFISRIMDEEAYTELTKEIVRFYNYYDLPEQLFQQARRRWKEVEDARGKGSLKREKDALRGAQEQGAAAPLLAVDGAYPDVGVPQRDVVTIVENSIEDQT